MARVQVRLPPAMTGGQMTQVAPRNDQSTQVKEKPKYTVTMEQVTEKKKKLLSQVGPSLLSLLLTARLNDLGPLTLSSGY